MPPSSTENIRLGFLSEAFGHLDTIQSLIFKLADSHLEPQDLSSLINAAHSIKGGAGMVEFHSLSELARRMEDFLKVFKNHSQIKNPELEKLLLLACDQIWQVFGCNREGKDVDEQWLETNVYPIFEQLHFLLLDVPPSEPKSDELASDGQDVVVLIFQTEVEQSLQLLESVLASDDKSYLFDEVIAVVESLAELGEMLSLTDWISLCESIAQRLEASRKLLKENPEQFLPLAEVALQELRLKQAAVLSGFLTPVKKNSGDDVTLNANPGIKFAPPERKPIQSCPAVNEDTSLRTNKPKTRLDNFESLFCNPNHQSELVQPLPTSEYGSALETPEFKTVHNHVLLELKSELERQENKVCLPLKQFHHLNNLFAELTLRQERTTSLLAELTIEREHTALCLDEVSNLLAQFGNKIQDLRPTNVGDTDSSGPICSLNHNISTLKPLTASDQKEPTTKTILVVDDSNTVRNFLALTLETNGYRVELAEDGEHALEQLLGGLQVGAIICDLDMPRLDGYGLLSRVKSDPALKHFPVAMLTSHAEDKYRERANFLGASAYFTKPCNEQELLKTLKQLV